MGRAVDTTAPAAVYRFDRFILDLRRGALLAAPGEELRLRHKSFRLLRLFVENAGHLLDRDKINQTIWPDVTVNDDGITQCVGDIRRALGDETQAILRTVPRRGYIFAAEVSATRDGIADQPVSGPVPLTDKPSIAVLPFANLSTNPEQVYFADGITDDITAELARNRGQFVVARNTGLKNPGRALDIRQAASELGVRYVLDGSVRRNGGQVRVVAQLIEAETCEHIWAERYNRELSDIFSLQDEIATAVAAAIQPAIADAELRRILRKPPETLGAWEAYQRGLWHEGKANPADNAQARQYFHRAIELEPTFTRAYASIAMTFGWEGDWYATLPLSEARERATTWARKAVQIDATDAEAQATLAWLSDAEERQQRLSLALASDPHSPFVHWIMGKIHVHSGRLSEGRKAMMTALRLSPHNPLNGFFMIIIAMSHYYECDYPNALEVAQRTVSLCPEHPLAYRWVAVSLGQLGRTLEAAEALRKAMAVSPSSFDFFTRARPRWMRPENHEHMLDGLRKAGWNSKIGLSARRLPRLTTQGVPAFDR
jgi:adenylate cyclase